MIDLSKPLELSDGTRVVVHDSTPSGIVRVCAVGPVGPGPHGGYADFYTPRSTWYHADTGRYVGDENARYAYLRNVVEEQPPVDIEFTLKARGETYGSFSDNSQIAQSIKGLLNMAPSWPYASSRQKEAAHQIASKLSRLFSGDVGHTDSWLDIAGYAKLAAGEEPK
jgi:hypothetical protein